MKRYVWVAAVVLLALVGATVAWARALGGGSQGDAELRVAHAALRPSWIVLTVSNGSEETARVSQVIVNDAFVDFRQPRRRIAPGQSARVTIFYMWIAGEAYDIELMTSSGATVDYEIEDAATGPVAA